MRKKFGKFFEVLKYGDVVSSRMFNVFLGKVAIIVIGKMLVIRMNIRDEKGTHY